MNITLFRCLVLVSVIAAMLTATTSYAQAPHVDDPVALGLNKDLLVGRWSAGNEDITLTKSGASYISINNKTCPGTWTLSRKTLVIIPTKMMRKKGDPCSSDRAWQITSVSSMNLELIDEAKNQLHLTRQK